MLVPKCIYPKRFFAKCTWLACLLSFASLLMTCWIGIYFAESTPCQESRWFIGPRERGERGPTKPLLKNHHEQSEHWKLPLSLSIPPTGAHIFAKKTHYFGGFHSLDHTPYWCTHSWQNNHHFSSLGCSHERVLQMALAIHLSFAFQQSI